jgi:Lipocalin-like domain
MMPVKFILLFLITTSILSCKESEIIGHWKRLDFEKYRKLLKNDTSAIGNLTISSDSTFFINGDGEKDIDTVAGWHTGGDFSGTWRIKNKKIVVQYDPELNPYGMQFEIRRLSKRKLVLGSPSDRKHKNLMKYKRL